MLVKAFGFVANIKLCAPQATLCVRIPDYSGYKQHFPTRSCLELNFLPVVLRFQGEHLKCVTLPV